MLVLKTPPSGAQPLAAALDAEKFEEVAGTIAGGTAEIQRDIVARHALGLPGR